MTKNLAGLVLALGILALVLGHGTARVSSAAAGEATALESTLAYQTLSDGKTTGLTDAANTRSGRLVTGISDSGVPTVHSSIVGQAFVPTLTIGTTQSALGDTVSIDISVDQLPTGITGYDLDIEIVDPAIAIITGVNFSSDFPLSSDRIQIGGSSVRIVGVDLGDPGKIGPGATNVNLATLRVQALTDGSTTILFKSLNKLDDEVGSIIGANLSPGSIEVLNSPPSVNAGPDAVVDLGDAFVGTGSINDPGDNSWTGTVDYGDGTVEALTTIVGTAFSLNHTYQSAGLFVVSISISDANGAFGTDNLQVDVTKLYPTLPGLSDAAQDLNGDGLAEDVNGNGRLDFDDIVKLFKNISAQVVIDNSTDFDFNDNGVVDMDDIVQLFMILVSRFG